MSAHSDKRTLQKSMQTSLYTNTEIARGKENKISLVRACVHSVREANQPEIAISAATLETQSHAGLDVVLCEMTSLNSMYRSSAYSAR